MSGLRIGNRAIGMGEPALLIAEIGVNHDGSLARAMQLVELAAAAGADAVKLQLFRAERLVHPTAALADYQKRCSDESGSSQMLRRYELLPLEVARLVQHIRQSGLLPLATPFSPEDVELIEMFDLPAVKIASPDLVNQPLLATAARLGRPMIVSTGAATMSEVEQCVAWLTEWGVPLALMHCVSAYPTPAEHANLAWIDELSDRFAVAVGFSDHTTEPLSGAVAASAGACIVERHLTYDRSAAGPDHAASSDPAEFAHYVRLVRLAEKLRGRHGKRVLPIEQDVRTISRQSLVLRCDVDAGQTIDESHLTVQRPGTGIPAADVQRAVGQRARSSIKTGTILQWDMLSDAA